MTRDEQRAAYVGLLLSLTRQASPGAQAGLCDRIERAIAARNKQPRHRRLSYWKVRP